MPMDTQAAAVNYEVESTDIKSTDGSTEGNYFVNFLNAEGKDTTIEIAGAADPEFVGDSMVSDIEMIPDSSSDGRNYSIIGYYDKILEPGSPYELKKVLISEA
jgi:hypothetical protein